MKHFKRVSLISLIKGISLENTKNGSFMKSLPRRDSFEKTSEEGFFWSLLLIMFFCRDIFLDLLFIWMTTLVADKSLPFMFDSEPGLTHNQLVAKKQFIDLDRNRNGVGESNIKSKQKRKFLQLQCAWNLFLFGPDSDLGASGSATLEKSFEGGTWADAVWQEDCSALR